MKDDIATLWRADLNPDRGLSLQRQIHEQIRDAILTGGLPGGTRLPSSRALAARLGVARITVVQTYDQLAAEGYLDTRRGAGTFVSASPPDGLVGMAPQASGPASEALMAGKHLLLSGMPALDQFPSAKWARTAGRAARKLDQHLMYHSDVMGFAPLRKTIADYLRASRNVICEPSQVMVVSGLQQGLFLLARAGLEDNKAIILEDPGYDGMLAAAKATGHPVRYTGVDEQGAQVPTRLSGLLVTSPSRQYPLGHTMSLNRRLEILNWARENESLVFEDDYDSEFRYAGRPLNSLQGIDGGRRVIYGGTFSKSLFPALRLGYLILPHRHIDPVRKLRAAVDSFPSISAQQALHAFMEDGEFTRHIRRLRKVHARRKALFEQHARRHLTDWLAFQPSDAGLHLLALATEKFLASALNDIQLAGLAQQCGIGAVALSNTFQTIKPREGLLVGFANLLETEIESSIQKLAKLVGQETGFSS